VANVNCLEGMACPKCGSEEPFYISATATFLVYDDGTVSHAEVEWEQEASIKCDSCGHLGVVADFQKEVR
jgi:DNA-directed RNA polymerase subunit RPC12/RpoP